MNEQAELHAPAIRVRHLWHRFGIREVLRDVSFEVAHGEIFGFIGPNGAGKTTTIRVMATLLEPSTGRVEVDGLDVTIDPEKVRRTRSGSSPTSMPSISTLPAVGSINVAITRMVVVLPAPFGPMKPKISPFLTSKLTPRSTGTPP